MKKIKTIAAFAVGSSAIFSVSHAGELADKCIAALEADGRDTSGCVCLEEAVAGNDALIAEMEALGAIADPGERYAAASADAQAVMDQCTR